MSSHPRPDNEAYNIRACEMDGWQGMDGLNDTVGTMNRYMDKCLEKEISG